jgi:hypothetical protein
MTDHLQESFDKIDVEIERAKLNMSETLDKLRELQSLCATTESRLRRNVLIWASVAIAEGAAIVITLVAAWRLL